MVLKRILSMVRFLASCGLAFRGSNEQFFNFHNGNFLGTLELLAEYDDFLFHIAQHGNKNRGHVSYLSNTICDKFIEILGEHVRKSIVHELKNAKYFSIILDSTPDIENVDQLTIIFRYVSANSYPVERFLLFLPNVGHKEEQMSIAVLKTLEDLNIDFQNCRVLNLMTTPQICPNVIVDCRHGSQRKTNWLSIFLVRHIP